MDLLQADDYDYQVLADISQQYNPHDGDEAATALKNILMHLS